MNRAAHAGPTLVDRFRIADALHRAGHAEQAEALYRAILAEAMDHGGALRNLGILCAERGCHDEAVLWFARAVARAPGEARLHGMLAESLAAAGRPADAVAAYEDALKLTPDDPVLLCNAGVALLHVQRSDEALVRFERAVAVAPDLVEGLYNLGNLLNARDRAGEALPRFDAALALNPKHPRAHYGRGMALGALGRAAEALAELRAAARFAPDFPEGRASLGRALAADGRPGEAVPHYDAALALRPNDAELRADRAVALADLRRFDDAALEAGRALALVPGLAAAHRCLGRALASLDRPEDGIRCLGRALALQPEDASTRVALGHARETLGDLAGARAEFEAAVALAPTSPVAHRALVESRRVRPGDPEVVALEALARDLPRLPEAVRIELHFALGKACADLGQHARAFAHWRDGNALQRRRIAYDEAAEDDRRRRIRALFDADFMVARAGLGHPSRRPIFVLGMPRSGTTLAEQVLASHPAVFGAGERNWMQQIAQSLRGPDGRGRFPETAALLSDDGLRALGSHYLAQAPAGAGPAERITDKMPLNQDLVGLIHLALPGARIVYLRRDPVDACLSCFSRHFGGALPFACDLGELGRYHAAYDRTMAHWRAVLPPGVLLEVRYEDLVDDFEPQARRMLDHCGLGWDERCRAFHATRRSVQTASLRQVRAPLYRDAVGRASPYASWLGPLVEALRS